MIMDEPTTALDVVVQKEIMQQIEQLKDKMGFSILFITHDLSLMVEFSTRIAIMYAGEIVELAPGAYALRRPAPPLHPGLDELLPLPHRAEPQTDRHTWRPAGHGVAPLRLPLPPALHRCQPMHTRVVPRLVEVKPDHWVACHLYRLTPTPAGGPDD